MQNYKEQKRKTKRERETTKPREDKEKERNNETQNTQKTKKDQHREKQRTTINTERTTREHRTYEAEINETKPEKCKQKRENWKTRWQKQEREQTQNDKRKYNDESKETDKYIEKETDNRKQKNMNELWDVLALVYGYQWRALRDSKADEHAWNALCDSFISRVCELWGLPAGQIGSAPETTTAGPCETSPDEQRERKKPRIHKSLDDIPSEHDFPGMEPLHLEWARESNCFHFIVDCKPLAQIMNGQIPLYAADLEDCFSYALESIENI